MKKIPAKWKKIIRAIPGYDPIATAGNCWFDIEAAQKALDFFPECLTHVKGDLAGQPFELSLWEKAIVANIFGWKRQDGTRRYREVLLYVSRKNGKTTLAGGLVDYVMFCDREPGAEIYSAAADRAQAGLVFEQAAGMVRQEPALKRRARIFQKAIVLRNHSAVYKPISADAYTKHGYNTHMAIIDELHAQPNRDLVDALETSTGSRSQPIIIHITTADYDRPSICNEKHDYACKVRDGVIEDEAFLPVIYETPRDADWHSMKVWKKANPCYGEALDPKYFKRKHKKAMEQPSFENTFKRLHLNMKTEQAERWIQLKRWDKCAGLKKESLTGLECYGGIDLASNTDLAAFGLFFPSLSAVLTWGWVPKENAHEREKRDRVPYATWAKKGHLTLTEGNVIDYDVILNDIGVLGTIYDIQEIAIDRWGSTHMQTKLMKEGFDVVPFGQGFASLSAPSKEFEKLIIGKELQHNSNPVLRWNVSNVAIERDAADNIKPSKKKSTEKIDMVLAIIMAIGRATAPREEPGSVYDTRGAITIG